MASAEATSTSLTCLYRHVMRAADTRDTNMVAKKLPNMVLDMPALNPTRYPDTVADVTKLSRDMF